MSKRFRVVGINFDHFHMGDLLREVHEHPDAEIVGICDENPARLVEAARNFGLGPERVFTDYRACLDATRPDLAILCPSAATHGEWTRRVAEFSVHIMVEKPYAATLAEADAMAADVARTGRLLAINWPLRWMPVAVTTKRLIDDGVIGDVIGFTSYGGNRGPLFHGADKLERHPTAEDKAASWFYQRSLGGGSLLDYIGYGTTLGTWYMGGRKPIEVACMVDEPAGLEVDEHSITIARYDTGLSRMETRWGTFSDPWTTQPQPRCGFDICGTRGTLRADDYADHVAVQTTERPEIFRVPNDVPAAPCDGAVAYMLHCIGTGEKLAGPLSVEISRIGQQITDTAMLAAREKRTVRLIE